MGVRPGKRVAVQALVPLVLACAACGGGEPAQAPDDGADEPIVIESPSVRVAVGPDTLEIFAPTLLPFIPAGGEGEPSRALLDAIQELQTNLEGARAGLDRLGVRVSPVIYVPEPLGIDPEEDRAAGPRFAEGGLGFLLVHPKGWIRRLERSSSSRQIICAASRTFRMDPPLEVAGRCD